MLAKVNSGATVGLESVPVTVEVDIASGSLPSFTVVGLPDKAVEESKDRVRAAIKNSGADFPAKRITVNLAPADLPKQGPSYDLPIALAMLVASEQLQVNLEDALLVGELSLDGSLRHTHGVLPLVLLAREKGWQRVFLPSVNAREAAVVAGIDIYPVVSLLTLVQHLTDQEPISRQAYIPFSQLSRQNYNEFDFADIQGQEQAKRALEIAAAGGHNIHLKGPPGVGKTLLSRSLPSILPDLTEEEALEVTKIYSITGNIPPGESLIKDRPFRGPHHTTSRMGLVGGGTHPAPGEISLAHRGVLFLDEFPEFSRNLLEALRQPLEDGIVTISRAVGTVTYPAKFMLVAASNPCPCGYLGDMTRRCRCNSGQIAQYKKRVSGPIIDRIDLHIDLPAVKTEKLTANDKGESSQLIKARIQKARNKQSERLRGSGLVCNADMTTKYIKENIALANDCLRLLQKAVTSMRLSARSYYRMIKVGRTIADIHGDEEITEYHLAEALQYRPKEEN